MSDEHKLVDIADENAEFVSTLEETNNDSSPDHAVALPAAVSENSNKLNHEENKIDDTSPEDSKINLQACQEVQNIVEEKHSFSKDVDANDFEAASQDQSINETNVKGIGKGNNEVPADSDREPETTKECSEAESVVQESKENGITKHVELDSPKKTQQDQLNEKNKEQLQVSPEGNAKRTVPHNLSEQQSNSEVCSEVKAADATSRSEEKQPESSSSPVQLPTETKTDAECKQQSNLVEQHTESGTETKPQSAEVQVITNQNVNRDTENVNADKKDVQNSNQPSAPTKKGILQLEQMSHEDLLKQCKRQLLFLQKTKMKNDDLSRSLLELQNENKMLRESSTKTGVSAELIRSLQSENDRLLDEKESQSEVVAQLNKDFSKLITDLATCKEQMEETKGKCNQLKESLAALATEKKAQDAVVLELQSQIIVLRSERDTDIKKMGEKHSEVIFWEAKYVSVQEELEAKNKERLELQATVNQFRQELEQEKVMNLEIGDYERTLSDLNAQLAREAKTIEDLNFQLLRMKEEHEIRQKEIEHLEQQCLSEESRAGHLKEILETTRQQLASKCEEHDKLASALTKLRQQKEDILADREELQYQLSVSANNLLILEGELKQNREQSEKSDLSLKNRIASLTEELSEAQQQLESSRTEFHNYKVRVHSVLKQQKVTGSTTGQPSSNLSAQSEEQKGQMEWTLELCKGKIAQMTEQLSTMTVERDSLQKEQEWLLSKQSLLTQQMQEKEETLLQRLEELKQELDLSRSFWDTEKQQLLQQQKNLVHDYDRRISSLEAEHERHVGALVGQLEQLQKSATLFSPLSVDQTPQRHSHQPQIFDFMPSAQLSPSVDESFDICSQERQEGEGSECTDPLPVPAAFQTLVTSPASGFTPLERLLQTEPSSSYGNQDPEIIAVTINTLQKKVDHISELLNESEASNLRLSEQTRLLKEEIRRLERNTERHEHFANLEYLKNVVLKFNTTPSGSERERLVPVISTLLRLSPEEQSQMKTVANQESANPNGNAGWGNYLHRWSGLV